MNDTVRAHRPSTQETCTMSIYPNGTITDRGRLEYHEPPITFKHRKTTGKGHRSAITRFSKQSASRLRRTLATICGPTGWFCLGITLTVPGPNITITEWHRLWKAFYSRVHRHSGVALIWRIELQERGQPHIHCVCWAQKKVTALRLKEHWLETLALLGPYEGPAETIKMEGSTITGGVTQAEFKPGWISIKSREFWPGAYEHAVKIDGLDEKNDMLWWRYLAAHASKSKQAQLGWQGRQWGIFNKPRLALSQPTVIEFPRDAMNKVIRYLKRMTHNRHASNHGRQTWFINPDTARRICEWATGNCAPVTLAGCTAFSPFKLWKKVKRERAKAKRRELLGVPV